MDKLNNLGRKFDMDGKTFFIVEASSDGTAYRVVDVYGKDQIISVADLLKKGVNLY